MAKHSRLCGAYVVELKTGHVYVGSSGNLHRRFRDHTRMLDTGKHENKRLQEAWGLDTDNIFDPRVVITPDREMAYDVEQEFLDFYHDAKNFNPSLLCNIAKDARLNNKGMVTSKETREKIGAANLGNKHTAEVRRQMSIRMTGTKHTDETKAKIGLAHKGKGMSDKQKALLLTFNLGVKSSDETRARQSTAHKKRYANGLVTHSKQLRMYIDDVEYKSMRKAEGVLKMDARTIKRRLVSDAWPTWIWA